MPVGQGCSFKMPSAGVCMCGCVGGGTGVEFSNSLRFIPGISPISSSILELNCRFAHALIECRTLRCSFRSDGSSRKWLLGFKLFSGNVCPATRLSLCTSARISADPSLVSWGGTAGSSRSAGTVSHQRRGSCWSVSCHDLRSMAAAGAQSEKTILRSTEVRSPSSTS